ncbi:hypothetical protein C7K25_02085 [Gulosibacter molinativorax]|uniref:MarR family transcriptional regulator n=1 Tax=Gulosibacter molinativorax TaxID=256821 RepID=A0ABT7C670_9MICO|nr:hypothetical protein [Gulosibacter molinativorax]
MPCPPCSLPPGSLLLVALGLDAPGGIGHREVAEFVGLGVGKVGSCAGIGGGAVRVDRAHAELVAAGVLGPELVEQQRRAVMLVSLPGRLLLGCAASTTQSAVLRRGRPGLGALLPAPPRRGALRGAGRLDIQGVANLCAALLDCR